MLDEKEFAELVYQAAKKALFTKWQFLESDLNSEDCIRLENSANRSDPRRIKNTNEKNNF